MKLKVFAFCLFTSLSTSVLAYWFAARVDVFVSPVQVVAQVVNPFPHPLVCQGQVYGQALSGQIFTTYFTEQFLPAGGYRYAYVQTNPFLPFVGGHANIHCRYW